MNRVVGAAFLAALFLAAVAPPASADETRDVTQAGDFRERVRAALVLGKTKTDTARHALERALDDVHPQVRAAAATALHRLGDPLALGAVERARKREPALLVQTRLDETVFVLRKSESLESVRYGVELGNVSVANGLPADLAGALKEAVNDRTGLLPNSLLVDPTDAALGERLTQKGITRVRLDGRVAKITSERTPTGELAIVAEVEFVVIRAKDQTMKARFTGRASTTETDRSWADAAYRLETEKRLVEGAAQSAFAHAPAGFAACAQ